VIKYLAAHRIYSSIVVSSMRIDKKPNPADSASGGRKRVCVRISTEISVQTASIAKSLSDHSHMFADAFRFCG
jgi:hypothetical protein